MNLNLGISDQASEKVLDTLGIPDFYVDERFADYGLETYSFAVVGVSKLVQMAGPMAVMAVPYIGLKAISLVTPKMKIISAPLKFFSGFIMFNYPI